MNFKGIYLIFLNRPKEMFLSLQELTYNHSVPSNPCPIQPRSPLLLRRYTSLLYNNNKGERVQSGFIFQDGPMPKSKTKCFPPIFFSFY